MLRSLLLLLVLFGWVCSLTASEPTNDKEKEVAKSKAGYSLEADKARKAKMSAAELEWENILEANLGNFYLPHYKKYKEAGKETAWDYVEDVPGLPRVLIIGDSISRAYTLTVRKELKGIANVHRAPENCGGTKNGQKKLPLYLGDDKWDVITFNFGIHDRGMKTTDYAAAIEKIAVQLKKSDAKIIWIQSTPLSKGRYATKDGVMEEKNKVAAEVMKKLNIPIIDLHAVAKPIVATMQSEDGCHYKEEGNVVLGRAVAAGIQKELTGK